MSSNSPMVQLIVVLMAIPSAAMAQLVPVLVLKRQ